MNKTTYLTGLEAIRSVNPEWQLSVTKWAKAHRTVDFHVDAGARAEDVDNQRDVDRHARQEELWFDRADALERLLPKREVTNAARQLLALRGF